MHRVIPTALFLFCAAAYAQVSLDYKFEAGSTLLTTHTAKSHQVLTFGGAPVESKSDQTIVIRSAVKKSDKGLVIDQSIDSLKSTTTAGGRTFNFDSKAEPKPAADAIEASVHKILSATSAMTWQVHFDATGKLKEVTGTEDVLKQVDEQMRKMVQDQYDATYQTQAARQALQRVSSRPVSKGDRWQQVREARLEGGQTLTFRCEYEYDGALEPNGTEHRIKLIVSEVDYTIDPDGATPLRLKDSDLRIAESRGTVTFDTAIGQVVRADERILISGTLTFIAGGETLPASLDLTLETSERLKKE